MNSKQDENGQPVDMNPAVKMMVDAM